MKRLITAALAVFVAYASTPAMAVSSVDRVAAITASFKLPAAGNVSYYVNVLARSSEIGISQGSGRIEVGLRRCVASKCSTRNFAARLKQSELQVTDDLSSGKLQTRLFGYPLVINLDASDAQTTADGKAELYQPVLPSGQVRVWVRQSRESAARGALVGTRCTSTSASIFREEILDGVTPALASSLPSQLPSDLADLRVSRCG